MDYIEKKKWAIQMLEVMETETRDKQRVEALKIAIQEIQRSVEIDNKGGKK